VAENGGDRNRDSLLNGSSLSNLTGAQPSAKLEVAIRYPATSMAELLDVIHRLGHTGNLQINFLNGHAGDMTWRQSSHAKPPENV
jgi:hypothetical protein